MADIAKIKTPNGSVYDIRDDNAIPKEQTLPLSTGFSYSCYPKITDANGVMVYQEYYKKDKNTNVCDKIWRLFTTDASKYSELRVTASSETDVVWNFAGNANFSVKVGGKAVILEGQQGNVYQTGTITGIVDGTPQSKTLTFTPTIVILYDVYGHVMREGFSIEMGTKKFTMAPYNLAESGYTACKWVAFA